MVEEAARNDLPVAVSIRLNNGYIQVFQYQIPEGDINCSNNCG